MSEFAFRSQGMHATVDHWAPNEPLLQTVGGRRFYAASISHVWIGGLVLVRELPGEFATKNEALMHAVREVSSDRPGGPLPAPNYEATVALIRQ